MASFSLEELKCQQCHVQCELQLGKTDTASELKVFVPGCSSVSLNSSGTHKASVSFFPLMAYSPVRLKFSKSLFFLSWDSTSGKTCVARQRTNIF